MKLKKKDTVTALALTAALLACGGFPAACKKAPPSAAIPAAKTPADQKAVEWDYEQITVAEL